MVTRTLSEILATKMPLKKIVVLYGARQVGKSTLLKSLFEDRSDVLWMNGDEASTLSFFDSFSVDRFLSVMGRKTAVVIDEAQNILNIGLKLKQIYDSHPEIQIVASGSSSFDLANKINEPLTGRKREYRLFPLSFQELADYNGLFEEKKKLPLRLVFGSYPEVATSAGDEREILENLASSYLYKDILRWENIKKSERLTKLLQALALQIGSQVSYAEVGSICGLDGKTVEKYIAVLEQAFIIFRLPSFSRNLRNELKFSRKIYFYDNGIRNAVIGNYNDIALRSDAGALWENYMISERIKRNAYMQQYSKMYFWRTKDMSEIDCIEEYDGGIHAYEFKWNARRHPSSPKLFLSAYPDASFEVVTPDNYESFLMPPGPVLKQGGR